MNKQILIAGLVGCFAGAVLMPDYGWLPGAVLGGCLGQLLHLTARLQKLEQQVGRLTGTAAQAAHHSSSPVAPLTTPIAEPAPAELVFTTPTAVSDAIIQPVAAHAAETAQTTEATPKTESTRSGGTVFADYVWQRTRNFFLQGNPIVRMGMIVMLFGFSFLAKHAASAGFFPIQLRLTVVAVIAVVLIAIGWRTRDKKNGYGLVLQGGGIGVLYLTVYAANQLYGLLPTGLALALMVLLVVLGCLLAVLQNAQILALMATAGGFLAPVLTSDGSGSHVALFSFYLVLNLGILGVALLKTWRLLNGLGFVFTFAIGSMWGVSSYEPAHYLSSQLFLAVFFALYVCVSILFSIKQPPQRQGLVDGSLIFGLPLVGFGLQAGLLHDSDYGLAISALLLAAGYLLLAGLLRRYYGSGQRVITEAFVMLGVGFATLAVPLALDADWTSAAWALEAAGLLWVGLRQQRLVPRVAGYALYLAAAIALFHDRSFMSGHTPIVSGDFLSCALLAGAALVMAYALQVHRGLALPQEQQLQPLLIGAWLLWWLVAGFNEITAHLNATQSMAAKVAFVSASLAGSQHVASRLQWSGLTRAGYSLLPLVTLVLLPFLLGWLFDGAGWHPAANWGLPALLLFAAAQYRFLHAETHHGPAGLLRAWHVITGWLWLALLFWEVAYWQRQLEWSSTMASMAWFASLALPLVLLMIVADRPGWPLAPYRPSYTRVLPAPILMLLTLWYLWVCGYPGTTAYPHILLLNPLDLAQLAVMLIFATALKTRFANLDRLSAPLCYGGLAFLCFVGVTVLTVRAVHHYGPVPYEPVALWSSPTVQMALSIVWTLGALAMMVGSRHLASRPLWMAGAALLAVVTVKLFTQDLSGSGTVPRVVSFIAVGTLMLIIGYLSPLPTRPGRRDNPGATEVQA